MLIETHAHLDYPDFAPDFDEVLRRATDAGVTRIITIGTSLESSRRAVELAEKYPNIFAVIGVHPTYVEEAEEDVIRSAAGAGAESPRVVAIGETGLDYHWLPSAGAAKEEKTPRCSPRRSRRRPKSRSTREIHDGAYKIETGEPLRAAARSRGGAGPQRGDPSTRRVGRYARNDAALCRQTARGVPLLWRLAGAGARGAWRSEHLVSFTGIVTFKNGATVRDVAAQVPLWKFMVETDCPYLAPVPFRGKRCEPAHTRLVAESIAAARGIRSKKLLEATTETAENFFRFKR